MGADQTHAALGQCGLAEVDGNQRGSAAQHVIAAAGRERPTLGFFQSLIAGGIKPVGQRLRRMPGAGAGVDEIEQILGVVTKGCGGGHGLHRECEKALRIPEWQPCLNWRFGGSTLCLFINLLIRLKVSHGGIW